MGGMEAPRLKVSPRLRELMAYDKLAGNVPRILILEGRYWLDTACVNAAHSLGWEIESVPVRMEGVMPRENVAQLLTALTEFRPDFILSINLSGMDVQGLLARLFEDLCMPHVTWFVDDPRTILMGSRTYASPLSVALTWDKAYRSYLEATGFPVVQYVPLAVDPTVFNAEPLESTDGPPAFVGSSMNELAEHHWSRVRERPELIAAIDRAFDSGRVTRENFGTGLEAILEPAVLETLDAEAQRHAELVFFVEGTRRLRHALVRLLEPEGLETHGDEGWQRVTDKAKGPVNYTNDLPNFYRTCSINLNTTSIQMPTTVNQRVFDCPAAGGFLLTDAQSDLCDLFDVEREVARYHSLDECLALMRFYRCKPAARHEIAARARERVLGEHTYAHRLRRIVAIAKEAFGA